VAIPALSRLQDEPERFRNFYLKAIKLIAYISMPIVVAMGVLSHEIIGLILGKQWLEAGPIFMVLAVAAIWQPIGVTVGWIYISLGQTRRMFLWVCFAGPLIVLSFFIGLPWGAIGVATAYSVCITILIVPQFSFALMYSPIKLRDLLLNICHPFAASIMMGLSMIIIRVHLVGFEFIWVILGCLAIGGSVLLAVTFGLRSLRLDIGDIFDVAILAIRSN
jgi:O-antigen/teichoic acid export membrane protein